MESVKHIMNELEQCSNLIADAIIRKTSPHEDDITERQAKEAYGDKWLRKMKGLGLAKYTKIGGRNIYSRHQLNCLRQAERDNATVIFRKMQKP